MGATDAAADDRRHRDGHRIAIIGAGPVGLEAALYASRLGHAPTVYEAECVGANLRSWGHVTMFSPWAMNASPLGLELLRGAGHPVPDPDACPTGDEMVERYLEPLVESGPLAPAVRTGVRVESVGRAGDLKGDGIGEPRRQRTPFRLLLSDGEREWIEEADRVLDCSGVYGQHNWLGSGGIPAPGERRAADRIRYRLEEFGGDQRHRYAGSRTLLVGAGHSAATAASALARLVESEPGTRVVWMTRGARRPPIVEVEDDPLARRARLSAAANAVVNDPPRGFRFLPGRVVDAVHVGPDRLEVVLRSPGSEEGEESVEVDRIVALVGYRPDLEICRELQVHTCWATEGPMELAATLLADGGGDCLDQPSPGPEALTMPEPGFAWLGHKAYGRNPAFLLDTGREQIRDLFRLWEDRPGLDLYDEARRATASP